MKYKKIGEDKDNCREYYENEKGERFATVYNRDNEKVLYTITTEGEPIRPVSTTEEKSLLERVREGKGIQEWENRAKRGEVMQIM